MVSYCPDTDEYIPEDEISAGVSTLNISGTGIYFFRQYYR
jgi:sulfate adenylyltransferase